MRGPAVAVVGVVTLEGNVEDRGVKGGETLGLEVRDSSRILGILDLLPCSIAARIARRRSPMLPGLRSGMSSSA